MKNGAAAAYATIGAVLLYTGAVLSPWLPAFHFFPETGAWSLDAVPGDPSIRWYGRMIFAAAGGLAGFVLGRWIRRAPPWTVVSLIAAVALVVLAAHERSWFRS